MPGQLNPRGEAAPPVEPNVASAEIKKKAPKKAKAVKKVKAGTDYAYNLRNVQARVTLDSGREIIFAPRGQRGDLQPVSADEQKDSKFLMNLGYIFEVVPFEVAAAIIEKQATNQQAQGPSLWDHLTNEYGKKYERHDIHVEPQAQRSIVVGQIAPDVGDRHVSANPEGLVVRPVTGPAEAQVPGSRGHQATNEINSLPDNLRAEDVAEFMAWKRAQAEAQAAADRMGQS